MGRKFKVMPKLRNIDEIMGAHYNPRKVIPERLKQIEQSLKYLGFLSPIYINQSGLILSGHQRTTAAKKLGYTQVPVVVLKVTDELEEGINLHFNRATCDLDSSQLGDTAFVKYKETKFDFSGMVEIKPDTVFPCISQITQLNPTDLLGTLPLVSDYMKLAAIPIMRVDGFIPVVIEEGTNKILNGVCRVYSAFHRGWESIPAVMVPKQNSEYAYVALNYLSMDFDLTTHHADNLRHHAFRRLGTSTAVNGLSRTFTHFVFGKALTTGKGAADRKKIDHEGFAQLPTASPEMYKKYRSVLGQTIVDFGAGNLHDSGIMDQAGFEMYPFEPFAVVPGKNEVDLEASRELGRALFAGLVKHKHRGVDSVMSSYNLNSIPFHKDRMAYLCIAAAMCKLQTTLYLGTQHINVRARGPASKHLDAGLEPNMIIGTAIKDYKVQKFFYEDELQRMCDVFFSDAQIKVSGTTIYAKCRLPKRIRPALLREALELEFNLPHKKGRLDLVDEAVACFEEYTGMDLSTGF